METSGALWPRSPKGVARRDTVNLFPHWGNDNYGEVWGRELLQMHDSLLELGA